MNELQQEKERLAERIKFYEEQKAEAQTMINVFRRQARNIQAAIEHMSPKEEAKKDA